MKNGRPPAHSQEVLERERQALELRRAGATYDSIAQQIGYSDKRNAQRAVKRSLNRIVAEPAQEVRDLEADRLDRLQMAIWGKAMRGDLRAAEMVLRLMERRARLLGLDHADGLAERAQQLDEMNAALVMRAFGAVVAGLDLAPDQAARARELLAEQVQAITADGVDVVAGDIEEPPDPEGAGGQ